MKLRTILVAFAATMALNIHAQSDWTDVTSTYISDPDFENCTAATADVANGQYTKGASYTEWTCLTISHNNNQTWSNSAVFAYGSGKKLNNTAFPTTEQRKNETEDNKNALGVSIGRSTELIYQTGDVTLPAGHYILSVWGRSFNTKTYFPSQLGFVNASKSYKSTKTAFTPAAWEEDKVEFTLTEETTGKIQLGGYANSGSSVDHAIMAFDHVSLQYKKITLEEKMKPLLDEANGMVVPTDNIGDGSFQFAVSPIDAFTQAVADAQSKYDSQTVTEQDIANLSKSMAIYSKEGNLLNAPTAGKTYKVQLAYEWPSESKFNYLNSGYFTMGITLSNQGLYTLSIGTSETAYTDEMYYAQQFTLTPVDGVKNGYTISLTDQEGNARYVCSGSKVGGNNLQIRTTTNADDALTVVVQYAGMKNGEPTFHFVSTEAAQNTYISFNDRVAYCWGTNYPANIYYLKEKTASDMPSISLNLTAGKYATRIFPFVRTAEGELISELLDGKVNVYTCSELTDGTQLHLQPLEGELMAHVPYILEAVEDVQLELKGYGTAYEAKTDYKAGLLTGTYANEGYFPQDSYVLQTQNGRQAFYRVDADAPVAKVSYRAYLTLEDASASARPLSLYIDEAGTTDIMKTNNNEKHAVQIFSVDGKQLDKLRSGLNIVRMNDGSIVKVCK